MTRGNKWHVNLTIFLVVCCFFAQVNAQESNLHCKWVSTQNGSIFLDTLLVAPETITFQKPGIIYDFDFSTSRLVFSGNPSSDSLLVCYRTFPHYFNQTLQLRSYDEYDSLAPFKIKKPTANSYFKREELFSSEGIYKSGSLTRGISFGNSRSVGVTSSLNFQMEGKLTNDLNIRANITDQNIPFQPEGNTQQLREFDNVSIEVYNDKLSLRAGDIVLKNPEGYFLKYYKNVQGGQANINYKIGKTGVGKSSATISSAKGQFADITIAVQEGVQGPYKLRGPNGERFVIVLANSEKIYLDGRLLERGFNRDYVIDYNLGEISFNPSVLITRFSRVRATYEFSDRNYSRSIINTNHTFSFGKATLNFNHYQEKDGKNNPLSFELSNQDKLAMSLAGEDNIPIQISGDREAQFNENTILYQKKDTVTLDGNSDSVFIFSADSTQTLFRVTFSEVGIGNGDYILLSSTINGRVFEWVSPQSGSSQGSYAPVQFVPAPNKKQMTTVGVEIKISDYTKVYSEFAVSNHDLNLFSDIGGEDDIGSAFKTGFIINKRPVDFLEGYKFSTQIDFEHNGENFNPIDRFRYIEYDRDWSYNPNVETDISTDNIFNFNSVLEKDTHNKMMYRVSSRKRGDVINGTQHQMVFNKEFKDWRLESGAYLLSNSKGIDQSDWRKAHGEVSLNKFLIVPGYRYELDKNELSRVASDSILSSVMNYASHKFYLKSNDSLKTKFEIAHTRRTDRLPFEGQMEDFTSTKTTRVNLNSDVGKTNHLDLTFTYRTLTFLENFNENEDEETVLGKMNWTGSFFQNHIRSEMSYATSSSREIRREFVFIPVVNGEGTHAWRDLNEDGIQDVTEFFEAINFDERNYIKLFVPTDEFISAFNNLINWNLFASMPKSWKGESGLKKIFGRISNRTNLNINKKNTDNSLNSRFNPFQLNTDDEDLIFIKSSFRNTLFFNQSNPGFGFDITYFSSQSKQLISNGIDSRNQYEWALNSRKQITKELSFTWAAAKGQKENQSDFLEDRNFTINIHSFAPQLIWQPTAKFRLASELEYKRKENDKFEDELQFSEITSLAINTRWNKALKNSLDASFRFINIDFLGNENSPAGYELLEALRPGRNFTWNLNYRQKLSNGLQIVLSYDGRKSEDQRVIHLGRMQVSAFF